MEVIAVLIPVLVLVTFLLAGLALVAPRETTVQNRLRAYGYDLAHRPGGDLSQPFFERVILPVGRRFGAFILGLTPAGLAERTRQRLREARASNVSPGLFLLARAAGGLVLTTLYLLYALRGSGWTILVVGLALVFFYAGQRLPDIWLSLRIDGRRNQITKALPDALDLIVVCVEAGYGLEAAIAKVTESTQGPLAEEFAQALAEINLGRARRDALREMGERAGSADLRTFVAAILQAELMGVGIASALRIQADAMRVRRRQRAEELIAKAPVKMIMPLAAFIFPSLFVVLLGPAMMKIFDMFTKIAQ